MGESPKGVVSFGIPFERQQQGTLRTMHPNTHTFHFAGVSRPRQSQRLRGAGWVDFPVELGVVEPICEVLGTPGNVDRGLINPLLINRGVSPFSGDSDHFWREHPPNGTSLLILGQHYPANRTELSRVSWVGLKAREPSRLASCCFPLLCSPKKPKNLGGSQPSGPLAF